MDDVTAADTVKRDFAIGGMTCAACARRVERRVGKMEGVEQVQVNLATEQMEVLFDAAILDERAIAAAVEKAGFSSQLRRPEEEVVLAIGGMTCAACVRRLERRLIKVEGVLAAEVNLATEQAHVRYSAEKVRLRDLRAAVEQAGFVVGQRRTEDTARSDDKTRELVGQRRSLRTALLFWLPLFVLEMGGMAGLPVPAVLDFAAYPLRVGLLHLAMVLPVMWIGRRIYLDGIRVLFQGGPNMFTLVAIGTLAAFFYSAAGLVTVALGAPGFHTYFPAVSTIITLMLLGRYLEARSRQRAGEAMRALMNLRPRHATLLIDGVEQVVPAAEIEVGDLLRVRPGESLAADGEVVEGISEVDESMLTGESLPVAKELGTAVIGGSVNGQGALVVRATRVGSASVLAQMQRLVEQAQLGRAPVARLADVVSGYFVPVVMAIAAVSALAWYASGAGAAFAIQVFVAVLIIACPCSLGLATPAAIMVGTGRGAQLGVLFKSAEALETAQRLDLVVLDKTGTITEGKPRVVGLVAADGKSAEELVRLAAAVERHSEHPLAAAIVRRAVEMGVEIPPASGFVAEAGKGAKATIEGVEVRVGKASYVREAGVELGEVDRESQAVATQVWVAAAGIYQGHFSLADEPRVSSREGIEKLWRLVLDVAMLSGDKRATAEAIAQRVGIERVYAEVLPAEKAGLIKELQREGRCVAMVGDGVNDAPALAQANIGIAVASGTDVAAASADIVLMNNRVEDVARAIELSRATMRTIRQNLFWAFFYNVVGLPVAAGGLYLFGGPLLNPMLASLAMAFSSVSVVANALRLRRFGVAD